MSTKRGRPQRGTEEEGRTVAILAENRRLSETFVLFYSSALVDRQEELKDIVAVAMQAAIERAEFLIKQRAIEGVVISTGGPQQ